MTEDEIRREFEAWYTENDKDPKTQERSIERWSGGGYLLMQAASAWVTWQAAWERCTQAHVPQGKHDPYAGAKR